MVMEREMDARGHRLQASLRRQDFKWRNYERTLTPTPHKARRRRTQTAGTPTGALRTPVSAAAPDQQVTPMPTPSPMAAYQFGAMPMMGALFR